MFGGKQAFRSAEDGPRKDLEMTESAIRKISMLSGLRKQLSVKKRSQTVEQTAVSKESVTTHNISDQASIVSKVSIRSTESFGSSHQTSRYTISSCAISNPEHYVLPARPSDSSTPRSLAAAGYEPEPDPVTKDTHYGKPSYVTPRADFAAHKSQSASITPPSVGDELNSRLEGLKQFKAWGEKIHENSIQHSDTLRKAKCQERDPTASGDMVIIRHDLPLRDEADVAARSVDAPTPFRSPQVTPLPATSTNQAEKDRGLPHAALPPALDLQWKPEVDNSHKGRLRASSRTIIISSTPVAELEKLARSRSVTAVKKPAFESQHRQEKKYPPVSFPKIYNEKVSEAEPFQTNSRLLPFRPTNSKKTTIPSISPMSQPIRRDTSDVPDDQEPLATPHDKGGRPVFYSTVHYYTDCSHASRPVTLVPSLSSRASITPTTWTSWLSC